MGFANLLPTAEANQGKGTEALNVKNASESFGTSSGNCVSRYQCDTVGRHFYSKRIRHSWTLKLNSNRSRKAETLCVEVLHSRLSGNKRVHVDGVQVFQTRARQLSWSLTHASGVEISVRSDGHGFRLCCHEPHSGAGTKIADASRELDHALKLLEESASVKAAESIISPPVPEQEFDIPRIWKLLAMPANLVSAKGVSDRDAEKCRIHPAIPMGSEHPGVNACCEHQSASPANLMAKFEAGDSDEIPSVASAPWGPRNRTSATQKLPQLSDDARGFDITCHSLGAHDVEEGDLRDPCLLHELHQTPGFSPPGSIDDGCQPCSERERLLEELGKRDKRVEALRRCLARFEKPGDSALVDSVQNMEELHPRHFESAGGTPEPAQNIATYCMPRRPVLFGVSEGAHCKRLIAELPAPSPGYRADSASRPYALSSQRLLPMLTVNTPRRTGIQPMEVPEFAGQLPQPFSRMQTQNLLENTTSFNHVALSPPHVCHSDVSLAKKLVLPKPKLLQCGLASMP